MSALSEEFEDFEVHIAERRPDWVYPVSVFKSPAGQAVGEFELPLSDEELETAIARMQALNTDEAMLKDFGARLFSALFKDDVRSRYAESAGIVRDEKGLRIRLHIDPPELSALPWELLYDPEKQEFLGLSKRALITRYLHVPRPPSPLQAELPLRILVVIASPGDLPELDSDAEVAKIETALALSTAHNLIQFDVLRNATTRALRDALLKKSYDVLHFVGHGGFDEDVSGLAFEDRHGDSALVSGQTLGTLLKTSSVRLVVLNACQSGQNTQNVQAFSGVGPDLVRAGIPAVVAMQFVVEDSSAVIFAQDFYEMLARFLSVDECVSRAREGLMLEAGVENIDWAKPVLYLRAPDGVIFTPAAVEQVEEEELVRGTGVYLGDLSTSHRAPPPITSDLPQQKDLINYLWALVDCPTYRRWAEPHEAMSRWVARYEDGLADELTREDITAVVERERVTVVLGEAGMGKTPNLQRLVYVYAQKGLRAEGDAWLPVFVKLSQYGGEDSLVPLVRVGLNRHGQINLSAADDDAQTRALLSQQQFIFLMSGLCKLPGDEGQRDHGIATVKRFINDYPQHKHVITCRTSFYENHLQGWPRAWLVLPHSGEDVQAYFFRRLGEVRGKELYQNLPVRMRVLARIPLILSILLDDLHQRGNQAARQRGPLFAHFVTRTLSQGRESVSTEHHRACLTRLAFTMKRDRIQEYTWDQTLEVIETEISRAQPGHLVPEETLNELIASGLLRVGSTARVAFAHPWFQDFFAACALQEEFESGTVDWEGLAMDYRWHDVIVFLASLVQQPKTLVKELLAHNPLLAAECMLEAETATGTLGSQIGEALAEIEKTGAQNERERATELLSELQAAQMLSHVEDYRHAVEVATGDLTMIAESIRGYLVVSRGHLAGLRFTLMDGNVYLGRTRGVSITLKDKSVSRRHAEIRVDAEEIAIRDLGSTNGTRVNGKQISSWRVLEEGDEIRLGDLPLTLELPEH